jgi:hypothetical protein
LGGGVDPALGKIKMLFDDACDVPELAENSSRVNPWSIQWKATKTAEVVD